jgi:hypothetical protein
VSPGPILRFGPPDEQNRRVRLAEMLRESPIPDAELMLNVGMYLTPQALSRVLFMDFLYRQILDVQGIVMDFGCRWGQNMSLFTALRGIYEPYNRLRRIVGFDTFSGFPATGGLDGDRVAPGDYATRPGYQAHLEELLSHQEQEGPLGHLRQFEIHAGDAADTVGPYLERNTQTVVALAYFDFDLYAPTKACLSAILPYLTKGTVIGFDELNDGTTPGETVAVREVLGLGRYAVKRFPWNARSSYLVVT